MAAPRGKLSRSQVFPVLLIEDEDGDAALFQAYLEESTTDRYTLTRASNLTDALEHLRRTHYDAVLLDLTLPDSRGTSSVGAVRDVSHVPVIVLTGMGEDELAMRCLEAGAEDYLRKNEVDARALLRALGYAIIRRREAELRTISDARAQYQTMSNGDQPKPALSPLRARAPDEFRACATRYYETLISYTTAINNRMRKPREGMSDIADRLGRLNCAPRDLIAVHAAALELASGELPIERQCELVVEGRLFALEMMGVLLEFYRSSQATMEGRAAHDLSS
ncbi:response regulator transcription factor [Acuticoccus sp. I52.16.1]|uniref:response regulator transcription factor n=1 Tax=Acuticoccus sp. I52.16.1 TaxID=2928472 RepID=UPI001FD27AA7|nr:response regulator [Acuticoccus sp. I52.16.1]UOM35906.1 response regulator [Acuticoccus sp. I52.16.1]